MKWVHGILVGKTERLGDRSPNGEDMVHSHEDLYREYITNITIKGEKKIQIRIDSFCFLYSLIRQLYLIEYSDSIYIEIGEGLTLLGSKIINDDISIKLFYCDFVIRQDQLTSANLVIMQSQLIAKLVESLQEAEVDVEDYIKRFPPPLF